MLPLMGTRALRRVSGGWILGDVTVSRSRWRLDERSPPVLASRCLDLLRPPPHSPSPPPSYIPYSIHNHESTLHNGNRPQASQELSAGWTLMRIGEQGVLSLEQWLEQEAAAVRDAEAAAAAAREGDEAAGHGQQSHSVAAGGGLPSTTSVYGGMGGGGAGTGGFRVGVDPWLMSTRTARSLKSKLEKNGGCLVPISG